MGLAFQDMGVNIADLSDFVNVETTPFQENLPLYPIPREPQLNFLKHGSHEVLTRPVHVHDHLPPMLPPAVEGLWKSHIFVTKIVMFLLFRGGASGGNNAGYK